MNTKRILFILFIMAQALTACGTATQVAEQPTAAPSPAPLPTAAPTATPEPVDLATIAQAYHKAILERDIEAVMALLADDVQCRGNCYLNGKQAVLSLIQTDINSGGRVEFSDLVVEGDKVTYNWTAYSDAGFFQAGGVETLQIRDGKIILIQTEVK